MILVKKGSVFQYLDWAGRLVTNRCGAWKKDEWNVSKENAWMTNYAAMTYDSSQKKFSWAWLGAEEPFWGQWANHLFSPHLPNNTGALRNKRQNTKSPMLFHALAQPGLQGPQSRYKERFLRASSDKSQAHKSRHSPRTWKQQSQHKTEQGSG